MCSHGYTVGTVMLHWDLIIMMFIKHHDYVLLVELGQFHMPSVNLCVLIFTLSNKLLTYFTLPACVVRCKCSNCSLEFVAKYDECRCCREIDQCKTRMEDAGIPGECVTVHPGFSDNCLKRWVLRVAGIGLKTKKKKSYTVMWVEGDTAEHE